MHLVLIKVLITLAWYIVNLFVGFRLAHMPKPYGWVKMTIHIVLFIFIMNGVVSSIYSLHVVAGNSKIYSMIALYVAALTVMVNLIVGVRMLFGKGKNRALTLIHKQSAFGMGIALLASVVFLLVKI